MLRREEVSQACRGDGWQDERPLAWMGARHTGREMVIRDDKLFHKPG
jgi:hypothetical protein